MTVSEVPAWIVTESGPEHVQLPIPATEFLAERRAVVVGIGDWQPTDLQLAFAAGRREATFGDPLADLPFEQWRERKAARGY
ncbi:hypothetical protein [Pseudonocardia sp.]|jgi:hypothetical protein|uniref:hypothetical protein n=1 Tax=Pseudonocardia sp. TaxID=60912 RepID=UPI0031FD886A